MKASNIYQKLKSAGVGNPDGVSSKPLIKGVGIKSPLNMGKPSPNKLFTVPPKKGDEKGSTRGNMSNNDPFGRGKAAEKMGLKGSSRGNVKDSSKPKPYVKKGGKATGNMKDYAIGSDARKAEYDARGWKYDDTIKGYNKDGSKKVSGVKPNNNVNASTSASTKINAEIADTKIPEVPKANAPKSKKTVKTENKVNRLESRKSTPRRQRRIAKQKAKLEGKSRKEIKSAKLKAKSEATLGKIGEQAAKGEGQNKAKVERLQRKLKRQIARGKKSPAEMKSPNKLYKKSPNKLNKGFDKLPKEVQDKILKKKGSPAKLKDKDYKPGKKVKTGGSVSSRRAEKLIAKGKGRMVYKIGGIGKDNQPGGKNNKGQLMKTKKKSVKIKNIK